jgi:Short C-terminal domain
MRNPQLLPWSLLACLATVGCTSYVKPEIVPIGPNAYLLSRASKVMGWGNLGEMKAEVHREANAFAESKGKVAITISTNEAPVAFGKYAFFELKFRLVDKNDPEALNPGGTRFPQPTLNTEKTSTEIPIKDVTKKGTDLFAELTKLDELRKKGLLTDAEFEAEKKKLLARN